MSKSLVRKQFGPHAAAYATSSVHAEGESLGRLVELVKPEKHWRALDVATAAGHTALAFAPHVAHVIASDLTHEMLLEAGKLAKKRGLTNVETATADAEALPFQDAGFDLVTCRLAPHHFPDVARFIAEVWRVLKPGGTFALVDNISPSEESTTGFSEVELRDAAVAYNAYEKLRDPSHGRCLTISEWETVVTGGSFNALHKDHLRKDMQFDPWLRRMSVEGETAGRLEAMLLEGTPALRAFLKPHQRDGALWFTLHELLFVAKKPI